MRIAMISTPFVSTPPRDYGGTELVIHELTEGLVERGHEVTIFATGDSVTTAELRYLYPEAQWPPDSLIDLNHVSWAMQQVVAQGPFDVVHGHSAVALACARLAPEMPLVYTLHHERVEQFCSFYRAFPEAHYIAISHDQHQRETPLPHCDVVHHGLDARKYEWVSTAADYVCSIGRLSRVKGPHTAIDCATRAGVPIRVAGDVHPPDRAWADSELEQRLALPHVTPLGAIGHDVKAPLLRDARALLMPIEWNEPFGLIMIEAMLSGCPVVAFDRGSVREIVQDGVTGFIASSADHMVELIRPGGVLDRFDRARCRDRAVEAFSRERMVREHERVYQRVMARFPQAVPPTKRRVA
jgi:glycosyltransferase involved in cell wall biosynthesis